MAQRADCGIDLGGTKVAVLLKWGDEEALFQQETGEGFCPEQLVKFVRDCAAQKGVALERVGFAVPGLLEEGRIVNSGVLPRIEGWEPTASEFGAESIRLINDADAALFRVSQPLGPKAVVLMVMVGTAVGCGIAIGGEKFGGAPGFAGELGYWPIDLGDRVVRLDFVAGGRAILLAAQGRSAQEVIADAESDEATRQVIQNAGTALGLALAGAVNLINPTHLFIDGGTLRYPGYFDAALAALRQHALPQALERCEVGQSGDGGLVVLRGALDLSRFSGHFHAAF